MIDVPSQVKEILQDGRTTKKYRIIVLKDDDFTTDFVIDNDTLVSESVNIDERMCSGDTIKFGLCEGSSLEFQYFDHPLITGRRLQVFIDVDYGRIDITKNYTDIQEMHKFNVYEVEESGLFRVIGNDEDNFESVAVFKTGSSFDYYPTVEDGKTFVEFPADAGYMIEVVYAGYGSFVPNILQSVEETRTVVPDTCNIPMGYFTAEKCSRQASTGIIKATAYNKLQAKYLDEKGNAKINELFVYDYGISIFDLKRIMLDTYMIPYPRTELASSSTTVDTIIYTNLPSINLSQVYGVDSPINGYTVTQAGYYTPTSALSVVITVKKQEWYWPTPWFLGDTIALDAAYGFLLDLEKRFAEYIKDLIDGMKCTVTGSSFLDSICYRIGFQNIFGVYTGASYSTTPNVQFSTIQKEYNGRVGSTNPVSGTLADAMKGDYPRGTQTTTYQRYACYIPYSISIGGVELFFNGLINYHEPEAKQSTYNYWADSSLTDLLEGTVKALHYSDGTVYDPDVKFPMNVYRFELSDLDKIRRWQKSALVPEFTTRELLTASFELECQFGMLDRETDLFAGAELNYNRLLPAEDLYPDNALYPGGAALSSHKSMYSKLWGDEGKVLKWRNLIIIDTIQVQGASSGTYVDKDVTYELVVNEDGNVDYVMDDNWIFKNLKIFSGTEIRAFGAAMVAKMRNVRWFPFEMWCAGLPYLETGDEIEVSINSHTYPTYILQRQLKGIHNLQDTYINGTLDIF